ncbi:hypothetical protein H920_06478 [Fukomys damarensis]|uniref:Uncharacterized protein n=1 Tax=Fukomys damarensis TaxID=885580 RepID=A0A091DM35_FUKDA|nr:hypothetical protein H920_06478 [Fukomys damarensis]
MTDLCHQAEGTSLESEMMPTVKIRAPLTETAAIPSGSETLSSSSNENSLLYIRKTISSKLLLENQQANSFPSSSPFMAIGNNLQVGPLCPDHADSVQLGTAR